MKNKPLIVFIAIFLLALLPLIINIMPKQSTAGESTKSTDNTADTIVEVQTTLGNFDLQIFTSTMPITGGNFVKLVNEKFYDGVIFHRIIAGFMIQGGDPTGTGMGGPGYKIKDEFTKSNKNNIGTISMANSGPNTGGSQFFINVADNNYLDTKHPVFGKVINGMDIIKKIELVETDSSDRPLDEVKIISAKVK